MSTYKGPLYIKNIYRPEGVSPSVVSVFGDCVTIEYTDDKNKCNHSYLTPEYQTGKLDYSVQTPSIYPVKSKITRISYHPYIIALLSTNTIIILLLLARNRKD